MRSLILSVLLVAAGAASAARAQEGALSRLYGQGVHAYFGGNLSGAERLFTTAIQRGIDDPRCYYFRGLAYYNTGRTKAAIADFQRGAELEVAATRGYDVGIALERVQGQQRLMLEQYRSARLAEGVATGRERRQRRLESIQRREPEVVTPPTRATLDEITGDAEEASTPVQPEVERPFSDPFDSSAPPGDDIGPSKAGPTETPPPADTDPFGGVDEAPADDTPPTVVPDDAPSDDPFGGAEAPAEGATDTAPVETAPPTDTAAPADESDPFGSSTSDAEEAAPTPLDDTAPADADSPDPFGGSDEMPADGAAPSEGSDSSEVPPAEEAPADETDPFGT